MLETTAGEHPGILVTGLARCSWNLVEAAGFSHTGENVIGRHEFGTFPGEQ